MITSAQIARFRGIRDLIIDGFGRVNLVVGKNDCGKTGLLEALQVADAMPGVAQPLYEHQRKRLRRGISPVDFEHFWRPFFFNLDAKLGFSITVVDSQTGPKTLAARQGARPDETITQDGESDDFIDDEDYEFPTVRSSWSIDLQLEMGEESSSQRIVAAANRVRMPPVHEGLGGYWIDPGASLGSEEVRLVSELKQTGRDGELLELLREVDERLSGIELLSPSGSKAELFVRLDKGTPLLPVGLMGDGFQRCLEIGTGVAADNWPTIFIDEIENGLHHLALEPLWRWVANVSRRRNMQIFMTTHSEECIRAACQAFSGLGDEGLRVIRLDRLESGTRAVVYDRTLLETAVRTETEIRG